MPEPRQCRILVDCVGVCNILHHRLHPSAIEPHFLRTPCVATALRALRKSCQLRLPHIRVPVCGKSHRTCDRCRCLFLLSLGSSASLVGEFLPLEKIVLAERDFRSWKFLLRGIFWKMVPDNGCISSASITAHFVALPEVSSCARLCVVYNIWGIVAAHARQISEPNGKNCAKRGDPFVYPTCHRADNIPNYLGR